MPFKKQNVVVEAMVPVNADEDAHPEHPIYIPVVPPEEIWGDVIGPEHPIYIPVEPPLGFWGGVAPPGVDVSPPQPQPGPEHPIYIPITPPPDSGLAPEHPIYVPIYPEHPIVLPPDSGVSDDVLEKLKAFLTGNLPPFAQPV
jgi:hypothetical protein